MATGNTAEWRALISTSAMRLVKKYAFGMFVARKHSATCARRMKVKMTATQASQTNLNLSIWSNLHRIMAGWAHDIVVKERSSLRIH